MQDGLSVLKLTSTCPGSQQAIICRQHRKMPPTSHRLFGSVTYNTTAVDLNIASTLTTVPDLSQYFGPNFFSLRGVMLVACSVLVTDAIVLH